jgi:TPR repeat protein
LSSLLFIGSTFFFLAITTMPASYANENSFIAAEKFWKNNDYHSAFGLYMKAAKQGNKEAQFRLGKIYLYGVMEKRESVVAANWLNESSNHGMTKAAYLLGAMCLFSKHDSDH